MSFFDLPFDEKLKAKAPYPGYPYGYLLPQAEALAKSRGEETPPDLKESFNGGPLSVPPGMSDPQALAFCYAETIWPPAPPGFRAGVAAPTTANGGARRRASCASSPSRSTCRKTSSSRFIDHADQRAPRAQLSAPDARRPIPGQLRAGAHSDYGSLTILLPEAASGGLEIFTPEQTWRAGAAGARRLHHQPRRPDGALDQRPLGLDPPPGGQPSRPTPPARPAASPSPISTSPTGTPRSPACRAASAPANGRNTSRSAPGPTSWRSSRRR